MAATSQKLCLCNSKIIIIQASYKPMLLVDGLRYRKNEVAAAFGLKNKKLGRGIGIGSGGTRHMVCAATQGSAKSSSESEDTTKIPSWAKPDSEEPPPWVRDESSKTDDLSPNLEIPFYVYLLASSITAIAAIGSIFEYVNQRPVFGIVNSDSIFYAPLLGFFAFTGIPSSAYLWFKSVEAANKEAEEQDRRDGYL